MAASKKKRTGARAAVVVVLCLVLVCVVAAAVALGLVSRRVKSFAGGASFSLDYQITSTAAEEPALYKVLAQLGGPPPHCLALPPGADHDLNACRPGQHDARAVLDRKFFQFVAGSVVVDAAVRHGAVYVQYQQADHAITSFDVDLQCPRRFRRSGRHWG